MRSIPRLLLPLFIFCLGLVSPPVAFAGDDWEPENPADLLSKTAMVDKDADAEAVFWKVRVADNLEGGGPRTVLNHYIRIKIFTDRGRETYSRVDIPYLTRTDIKDVAARTIKPDGSIIELKKEDVFEKTIVKVNGLKLKAKSFAMPGVETGAIIEYRWREVRNNSITFYARFDLQRDIPVRLVEYHLKPAHFQTFTSIGMSATTRALLASLNIQSYPVLIFSGDPTYVRETWVSPSQFNHCIIAIKVSDDTKAATVITHPALGSLLIFDATDDDTPVGDLPEHEQGSFALIAAGDSGSLVKMPETPSEANSVERRIEASLSADGSLSATLSVRAIGQRAVDYRREFHHLSRPEYVKLIEGWVTTGATAAKVSKVEPADGSSDGRFDLDIDFSALAYAQLMQGRLLVFKPALVARRESVFLTDATRHHPVVLNSHAFTETVHLKLPTGFDVDELPDPLKIDAPFGSYKTTYEVKNGELIFTRALAQHAATIPVDQYKAIRSFFERIRAAEQSPVVLMKK